MISWSAIWKDPVGSKIIASAVVAIGAAVWAKLDDDFGPALVGAHPQVAFWVIVGLILLGLSAVAIALFSSGSSQSTPVGADDPKVSLVNAYAIQADPVHNRNYPVKLRAEFTNHSASCIDVAMAGYSPGNVTLEKLLLNVFQLKLGDTWLPSESGIDRIAVLPGQMFRIWLGVEKEQFSKADQVRRLIGRAGTLALSVNGKRLEFPL